MRVGSLFSGIGGFDLGLERAGCTIRWQVEIDPYCQRVLAKHWPTVPRYGDIRAVDWGTVEPIDLLCGGFPCQDLSFAGKRAGIDGERSGLWSEYVRAIRALRPRYVIVENVPGLLTNPYMGRVLGDLAQSGYDAEWDCIPASAVGAPHRRDRVWIVAYPSRQRCREAGTDSERSTERLACCGDALENPDRGRLFQCQPQGQSTAWISGTGEEYRRLWLIEPELGRVAHGIPATLDIGRLIRYIDAHGNSSQVEMAKEITADSKSRKVRILRLYLEVATASRRLEETSTGQNPLSAVPYQGGSQNREMGKRKKEKEAVRSVPPMVSPKRLPCSQDMREEDVPLDPGEVERRLAVGMNRVDRLKGLGNAIVPQIAEALGGMILDADMVRAR